MKSASPVVFGLEPYELKIGGAEQGQPQYETLHALRSPDGQVMSRWELTPQERLEIANGADVYLTVWTFNNAYPPTCIQVLRADANPDYFKVALSLDDELALRIMREDVANSYSHLKQLADAVEVKKKEYEQKAQTVLARISGQPTDAKEE